MTLLRTLPPAARTTAAVSASNWWPKVWSTVTKNQLDAPRSARAWPIVRAKARVVQVYWTKTGVQSSSPRLAEPAPFEMTMRLRCRAAAMATTVGPVETTSRIACTSSSSNHLRACALAMSALV